MSEALIQRCLAEVKNAPAEQVEAWRQAGELAELLAGRDPGHPEPSAGPQPAPVEKPPNDDDDDAARLTDVHLSPADLGARASHILGQIGEAELATMGPAAIDRARRQGRLNDLLGVRRR